MAKIRVSDEVFVAACLNCKSYAEMATVLGMAQASVQTRATRLRKAGVNLPVYARKQKVVNVTTLNALIANTVRSS